MKNIIKILILTCVIALPCSLSAQVSFSLGAEGGYTAPTATLATDFNSGYNIGGEAELDIIGAGTFYADVVYNSLTPKNTVLNPKNLNITEISVGYRRDLFNLGAVSSRVFIDAGAGLFSTSEYNVSNGVYFTTNPAVQNFGVNGGIGATFPLAATTRFIAKIKYNTILGTGNTTYITASAGINFKLK